MRRLVVVGHGMVGHRLVETIRARDLANDWMILVPAEEHRPAYDRVALSSYLAGRTAAQLNLLPPALHTDPLLDLRLGSAVSAVERRDQSVLTASGERIGYDALVLATGSRPFVPPVPGRDLAGCFVYRTFEDLDSIRSAAETACAGGRTGRAVVIGGGLLGLEAAEAVRLLGVHPRVVERGEHVMAGQLDRAGGQLLGRQLERLGIQVRCDVGVRQIQGTPDGRVRAVALTDSSELAADLVVFAAGVRPRDELAEPAGLVRGERGGFLVDRKCQTADPRIWAIGECAAVEGRCHGVVAPGYRMADLVAAQLIGTGTCTAAAEFDDVPSSFQLKLPGVQAAGFGDVRAELPGAVEVATLRRSRDYTKIVLAEDLSTVLGCVMVGDTAGLHVVYDRLGRPACGRTMTLLRR